jgi:hypothetical protein
VPITSNFFGSLTLNASYGGDLNFAASSTSGTQGYRNHFVFDRLPPNVLRVAGNRRYRPAVQWRRRMDRRQHDTGNGLHHGSVRTRPDHVWYAHSPTALPTSATSVRGSATPITGLNYNAQQEPFVLPRAPVRDFALNSMSLNAGHPARRRFEDRRL